MMLWVLEMSDLSVMASLYLHSPDTDGKHRGMVKTGTRKRHGRDDAVDSNTGDI